MMGRAAFSITNTTSLKRLPEAERPLDQACAVKWSVAIDASGIGGWGGLPGIWEATKKEMVAVEGPKSLQGSREWLCQQKEGVES